MDAKKLLKQYLFSLVLIFCAGVFFFGIVSVREKTRYNMDGVAYEKIEIVKEDGQVIIRSGDKVMTINTDYKELFKRWF